jgi:hypothetical protein
MCYQGISSGSGTEITLGSVTSKSECAEACILYPSYTAPCKSTIYENSPGGKSCTGYTNPEETYSGTTGFTKTGGQEYIF